MVGSQQNSSSQGPLTGVRVIDLSAVVSGPFGTSMLGDQGADVIMVEQAHAPDIIRRSGPLVESAQGVSAFFAAQNRNKRDRKSTRLNSSHVVTSRMPSSA